MRNIKILDTNVVSELTRPRPNHGVLEWVAQQSLGSLYITVITEAELRYGVELLYPGRRRRDLEAAESRMIDVCFAGRILPFESDAAPVYAEIRSSRRIIGHSIKELDCMIAAIARVNGATVVTRDVGGFEDCGVEVVNPWLD